MWNAIIRALGQMKDDKHEMTNKSQTPPPCQVFSMRSMKSDADTVNERFVEVRND